MRLFGTTLLALMFGGQALFWVQNRDGDVQQARQTSPDIASDTGASGTTSAPKQRSAIYYAAITDRPVFSQTRRPLDAKIDVVAAPVVEAPEPVPEPEALPTVTLLGLMGGTEKPRALLSVEGAAPLWLSVGQTTGPWTLSDAGSNWLEITADDQKIRLELFK